MTLYQASRLYEVPYKSLVRAVRKGLLKVIRHPLEDNRVLLAPGQEETLLELAEYYRLRRWGGGAK